MIVEAVFYGHIETIVDIMANSYGHSDITTCKDWEKLMLIFTDCAELLVENAEFHYASRQEMLARELRRMEFFFKYAIKIWGLSVLESEDDRKQTIRRNFVCIVIAITDELSTEMFSS
jgi:hypothetical protein